MCRRLRRRNGGCDEKRRSKDRVQMCIRDSDGIVAYVRELNGGKEAVHEPVYFKGTVENIEVEAAFQFVDAFEAVSYTHLDVYKRQP